jgi:hypothetical protein
MSKKAQPQLRHLCLSLTLLAITLAGASAAPAATDPIPLISQLAPLTAPPGTAGMTVLVNGTGFVQGAVVNWNGSPRSTQYISEAQLSVTPLLSDLILPGTVAITVQNPAGVSNVAHFQIANPQPALGFSGPQVPINGQAYSLTAGDFTGTGILDLVSGNDLNSSISISLGNGDGTFGSGQSYGVGASDTLALLAADFNGDGKLDVAAVADGSTSVVSILLWNGDGTFQAPLDLVVTSGELLTSVVAADFNADGKLDLAIMGNSNTVLVALGNGNGTFQTPRSFTVGNDSEWAAVGDFNQDGILDLAVANYVDSTVSVLLGNGDGTFRPQSIYTTGTYPGSIVTGDFNGDGKLDLAMTARTSNASVYAASVLLGNGDGTFQPQTEYTIGDEPAQIVAGDFNGDGKLDLATVNACGDDPNCGPTSSATISILAGNGDGTFQNHLDFPAGFQASQIVEGDFNDDGKADLATASGTLYVLLQTSAALSSGALLYPGQDLGVSSTPQVVTLTNTAALPLVIAGIQLTGSNPGDYAFTTTCTATLQSGANCTISVTFDPTAEGTRTAFVSITDSALGSPQNIALTGTGLAPAIVISPTSLTFPTTLVGRSATPMAVSISNPGDASLNISSITVSGNFTLHNGCGSSVGAGEGCVLTVNFRPTLGGVRTGVITIYDNVPGSPQTVTLTGTGTYFKLSTTAVSFGDVALGHAVHKALTLSNTATTSQTVNRISITGQNANEFSQTNNCGSSLGAGASCQITVTFKPTTKGAAGATLQVNGGGGTETATLAGSGT